MVPYWVDNRWVVIALKERRGVNQEAFEKDRKKFLVRLLQLKRNEVLQKWLLELKGRSKIEKYKAYNLI